MKRKLELLLIVLAFLAVFGQAVYGQNQSPIDLILVLDTSTGMSSSYDNVNNYITGSFLTEFLRVGDTFHLIAFSQSPRLDVARRIASSGDVETIIARMMLQYPIERGSNVSAAITYAEQYVASLPARPKKIVLVTTGGSDTSNLITAANQRLSSRNATIDFVQVTPGQAITNTPSSGRPPMQRSTPQATVTTGGQGTTGTSQGATVGTPGTTGAERTTPTEETTRTAPPVTDTRDQITVTDQTAMQGIDTSQSGFHESGDTAVSGIGDNTESVAQGDSTAVTDSTPSTPIISETRDSRGFTFDTSFLPWIIGGILLLLLLIGLVMLLSSRKLGSSPNRVMANVASSKSDSMERVDHSKDLARYAAGQSRRTTPYADRPYKPETVTPVVINPSGPLLLNLFVEEQNTNIGKRNIHSLKSGYSLSVGGGRGDGFLIFLVPLPSNLGELRRNGSSLSFIPKKPKYFPDLGSNELRDCLNKTIRIISDKNYELRFRFEMYEDPLISLNRMLQSVKVPG